LDGQKKQNGNEFFLFTVEYNEGRKPNQRRRQSKPVLKNENIKENSAGFGFEKKKEKKKKRNVALC